MTLHIAGIDEAGRGPLAGPVVVAAVVFPKGPIPVDGLNDSKALTEKKREALYPRILETALAYSIVVVEPEEIDLRNILQSTMHGMREALLGVAHVADCARIDGNKLPKDLPCPAEAWVGGDARDPSIMAASILAKVSRDHRMLELHAQYPHYGFDRHKGYPSPQHLQALQQYGPCPQHRRSFAPVRNALNAPAQGELLVNPQLR